MRCGSRRPDWSRRRSTFRKSVAEERIGDGGTLPRSKVASFFMRAFSERFLYTPRGVRLRRPERPLQIFESGHISEWKCSRAEFSRNKLWRMIGSPSVMFSIVSRFLIVRLNSAVSVRTLSSEMRVEMQQLTEEELRHGLVKNWKHFELRHEVGGVLTLAVVNDVLQNKSQCHSTGSLEHGVQTTQHGYRNLQSSIGTFSCCSSRKTAYRDSKLVFKRSD